MSANPILEFSQFTLETLHLSQNSAEQGIQKTVLHELSCCFYPKDLVAIVGASGSGKSLCCKLVAGITSALSESLCFTPESSLKVFLKDQEFPIPLQGDPYPLELKQQIGFLFQHYALFEDLSVEENILIGRDQSEFFCHHPEEWKLWYPQVLKKLGIDRFLEVPVSNLSGGQKQRVALARVLASRPTIIFYDEPTSGLDPHIASEVSTLIREVHEDPAFGIQLTILITHDYTHLLPIARRVFLINVQQKMEEKSVPIQVEEIRLLLERGAGSHKIEVPREKVLRHHRHIEESFFNNEGLRLFRLPFQFREHFQRNRRWQKKWFFKLIRELWWSAWLLIVASGLLIGGLISYFSLTSAFTGKAGVIQPILMEQLTASLGLILWTALSPLFAALFLALRSGASLVGYLGNLKTSGQIEAFTALGIQPIFLMFPPLLVAFAIGIPLWTLLHFTGASVASLFTTLATQPTTTRYFWMEWYFYRITPLPFFWVFLKGAIAGIGIAGISYFKGIRVRNATEINKAIQDTIFYSILYILLTFFILLVLEQKL